MIKKKSPIKKVHVKNTSKKTTKTAAKKTTPKKVVAKKVSKTPNASRKALPKAAPKKIALRKKAVPAHPLTKKSIKKTTLKAAPEKVSPRKPSSKKLIKIPVIENRGVLRQTFVKQPLKKKNQHLSPFLDKQRVRLLQLKDTLLDSMQGVARDNLHAGSETSAFGMHQADAGSDAYDRDFALSILSQEQNSLYEIDEALKRIDDGTYGVCEISNKQISRARLEARPFTRYTVECQADLEKRQHVTGTRLAVSALFGLTEEESENDDDENLLETPKD